jgi:hypothetical protein
LEKDTSSGIVVIDRCQQAHAFSLASERMLCPQDSARNVEMQALRLKFVDRLMAEDGGSEAGSSPRRDYAAGRAERRRRFRKKRTMVDASVAATEEDLLRHQAMVKASKQDTYEGTIPEGEHEDGFESESEDADDDEYDMRLHVRGAWRSEPLPDAPHFLPLRLVELDAMRVQIRRAPSRVASAPPPPGINRARSWPLPSTNRARTNIVLYSSRVQCCPLLKL